MSSGPSPLVDSVPPLDNTLGAVLIGTFIGLMLYGLIVHQSYRYFRLYPDDSRWTKVLVSTVLVFETFHIVLGMHLCYHYLITNYCRPLALLSGVWSFNLLCAMSGVVVIPSQSFFARRIFLLGGLKYRAIVVLALILFAAELGFLCAATAQAFASPWFSRFRHYTWLISAGTGTAFLADSILTGVLVSLLRRENAKSQRMTEIVETIMLYSVNTGLLNGIINLLFLLFSLLYPSNLIYGGFGIVATKLYANSLLAALNTRNSLQYTPSSGSTSLETTTLSTDRENQRRAATFHPAYNF